jgi:hypothetical protein
VSARGKRIGELAAALAAGVLFAYGLALAGMTRPEKVVGFLRFFRRWDPALMFVMAGAIAVHASAWLLIKRRPSPLLSLRFMVPARRDIDARLLAGAAIFGVGWALGGLCPGPGITSIATLAPGALVFVAAMVAGNALALRADPVIERFLRGARRTAGEAASGAAPRDKAKAT